MADAVAADERNSSIARAHQQLALHLRSVTDLVANNAGLSDLLKALSASEKIPTVTTDTEHDYSGICDLLNGRYFDDSTLPFPSIPHHDGSIYASEPTRSSTHSPRPIHASAAADALATEATLTKPVNAASSMAAVHSQESPPPVPEVDGGTKPSSPRRESRPQPKATAAAPADVAPPSAVDEVNISATTKDLLDLESSTRPAETVHLPPEDVQTQDLRHRRETEEESQRRSDLEKAARHAHLQAQNELTSSPSSTVGAYSAATPMLLHESPDTSPDSERAIEEVLPPKELRPTSEERREREEHDRILEAQKEIARKAAFGDPGPDDQLEWEARETVARDVEEQKARESIHGQDPGAKRKVGVTEAEHSVEDMKAGISQELPSMPAPAHGVGLAASENNTAAEDDDDSITVVPRTRPAIVYSGRQPSTRHSNAARPRIMQRSSSGAINRRSTPHVRDEHAALPSMTPREGRQARSPERTPLGDMRLSSHNSEPPRNIQTPRRQRQLMDNQVSGSAYCTLQELAPLKGAAEDPDRDYLEPLFRIQAHDSPNSHTKALPDLVKSAQKYLSTEDQFATLHERMDYRILRRIYQLQNANKWSLRQMDKVHEPAPPVTHQDHLMAEMRWMRKDFKAERKMKKSVCVWLAVRCADWIAADSDGRKAMQVVVKAPRPKASETSDEQPPDLDLSGDSAPEDELAPPTPTSDIGMPTNLVVTPELINVVCDLRKAGKLGRALRSLPIVGLEKPSIEARVKTLDEVSKFVEGKVLPKAIGTLRKRSRYEYEDDASEVEAGPATKRFHSDRDQPPEGHEVALFHPDNKHIRDRLHANNAFRPPSEFVMPGTSFYEFRNGSQWVWEDDQKLRKLAKEYSFNWSLIADEMTLPSRYKSSADRRTPWECFERWVELETLPTEMRKTMYFKTWFSRLEQSQQAAERRYQAQVQHIQSQAQNGQQAHVPQRRRTIPSRVEKRKNTRYLWLVDAMRKNAKKRENNAYKQAEAQRAAAQRKSQNDNNAQPRSTPRMTPQEFSKKRQERDLQIAEAQRQHRQKMIEAQQRQMMQARNAQQGGAPPTQQRPSTASLPPQHVQMPNNGQSSINMNGQMPQQARPPLPMATRNGHLAVPQVNAQGIPQAQMQGAGQMSQAQQQQLARIAQVNSQRSSQYNGQPYQMSSGSMTSPGGNLTTQQQLQHNQALLAQMSAQAQQQQQQHAQSQAASMSNGHQMSASPSMPPPPNPHPQQQQPQQLSSGHVPALMVIKNQLRAKHPNLSEDQLTSAATSELRQQSQNQTQSSNQARQNAMNAAAGIPPQSHHNMQQAYGHNQQAFQGNAHISSGNTAYMNGGNANSQPQAMTGAHNSPQATYATQMRQQMLSRMQQSPHATHAQLNGGSPSLAHASPNVTPASPVAYAGMGGQVAGAPAGRPSSRSNTPAMPRMGSSNSVPMTGGMQSPGALAQNSPRNMHASMAR
ncbi:RNA polymerase II transcription elongation factor SpEAF [Teratosphaeriaceae sp. CCFEE 6253]|nr:RNA polymerase II transcription elongation factor SpEAF [Teratosphaeriaceae sp. CCFEE 6253]